MNGSSDIDLAVRAQAGDHEAQRQLLARCEKMIRIKARSLLAHGLDMAELRSAGYMGVVHALRKFDPTKGIQFLTYAVFWVRAYQILALKEHVTRGLTHHPLNRSSKALRLTRLRVSATALHGEYSDVVRSISTDMNLPEHKVRTMLSGFGLMSSLNVPVGPESDTTFLDALHNDSPLADESLADLEYRVGIRGLVAVAYGSLKERERTIMRARYEEGLTLEQIGQRLGLSRERVRQLEARSLMRMRKTLRVDEHP